MEELGIQAFAVDRDLATPQSFRDVRCVSFLFIAGLATALAVYFAWKSWQNPSNSQRNHSRPRRPAEESSLPSAIASPPFRKCIDEWCAFSPTQQIQSLDEFRERLSESGQTVPDDFTCLRFLRARQFRLEHALSMYEDYCDWHSTNVEGRVMKKRLTKEVEDKLRASYPASVIGRDPRGRPVKFMDIGHLDMKALRLQGIDDDDVIDFHIKQNELLCRCLYLRDESTAKVRAAWNGDDVDESLHAFDPNLGCVVIMDMQHCTLEKFMAGMSVWKRMASIDQNMYPELLGQLLFIRPPRLAGFAWNMIKPLLDPRTVAKIEFVAGDPFDRITEVVGPGCVPGPFQKAVPGQLENGTSATLEKESTWFLDMWLSPIACCLGRETSNGRNVVASTTNSKEVHCSLNKECEAAVFCQSGTNENSTTFVRSRKRMRSWSSMVFSILQDSFLAPASMFC